MSERGLIDWRAAERVAAAIAAHRPGAHDPAEREAYFSAEALAAACAEALDAVSAYTGLEPAGATPGAEALERSEWGRVALRSLADAALPFEARLDGGLSLPEPFGTLARASVGTLAGTEAGLAVGYLASRVLGQYEFALFGERRPARLLFVPENLAAARFELDADPELFLRWVALHETTHVVQFEAIDWLAEYVRTLARELLESAAHGLDARSVSASLGRLLRSDPRHLLSAALDGELVVRLLADPVQRERLDRLQATMAAVEGHAEHVMDACGGAFGPELGELRRRLDARRANRGGFGVVVERLLGLELKLRQYAQGKAFFDAVERAGGRACVTRVWASPAHLPTLAEIARPEAWRKRIGAFAPASA